MVVRVDRLHLVGSEVERDVVLHRKVLVLQHRVDRLVKPQIDRTRVLSPAAAEVVAAEVESC